MNQYVEARPQQASSSSASPAATKNGGLPTPAEVESLIAKDLTGMSNEEREKAFEDVHGIASQTSEDPGFIHTCLCELEMHLETIKADTSYELAESMCPEYVHNTDFRLMFIRADFYGTKAAAERMIRFFDFKRSLFGDDKLGREITLDDFSADGMDVIKSGYAQISPCKDMAGRPIVYFVQKHKNYKDPLDLTRAGYYMFMLATKMPEAQKKGISCVYYYMDIGADNFSLKSTNSESRKSLPVYFASLHLCYNDEAVWSAICDNVKKLNSSVRTRFRPHSGTHEEVAKALSDYGIPRQSVPVNPENGKYILDVHHAWLKDRLKIESEMDKSPGAVGAPSLDAVAQVGPIVSAVPGGQNNSFLCFTSDDSSVGSSITMMSTDSANMMKKQPLGIIRSSSASMPMMSASNMSTSSNPLSSGGTGMGVTPLPDDVLFGRGKTVVEHPGNTRFRHVVDIYMNEYESAGRLEKTCIAEVIVRMVKDANGRFLKRDNGGDWEEVDDSTARKKVAHAFRNRRKLHGY